MKYKILIQADVTAADLSTAVMALYPLLNPTSIYFSGAMVTLPLRIVRTEELPALDPKETPAP